jgi:hypothetical protein
MLKYLSSLQTFTSLHTKSLQDIAILTLLLSGNTDSVLQLISTPKGKLLLKDTDIDPGIIEESFVSLLETKEASYLHVYVITNLGANLTENKRFGIDEKADSMKVLLEYVETYAVKYVILNDKLCKVSDDKSFIDIYAYDSTHSVDNTPANIQSFSSLERYLLIFMITNHLRFRFRRIVNFHVDYFAKTHHIS